jgi:hypothetical protein
MGNCTVPERVEIDNPVTRDLPDDWETSSDAYRSGTEPTKDLCPLTGGDCPGDPKQVAKCKAC